MPLGISCQGASAKMIKTFYLFIYFLLFKIFFIILIGRQNINNKMEYKEK